MASSSSNHQNNSAPTSPNAFYLNVTLVQDDPPTIFVLADPSIFRSVVQSLTGASPTNMLHDRRPNLHIELDGVGAPTLHSPSAPRSHRSFAGENIVMFSPVSPLEARGSPRSPMEEEERAIAGKGFYLHPRTPRGSDPPELLPLFPLHSLRHPYNYNTNNNNYYTSRSFVSSRP